MHKSAERASLFHGIPATIVADRTAQQLFCLSATRDYRSRDMIFCEGDSADQLFEVIDGVVKLYKFTPDGRCQITGFFYPGQFLGLEWCGTYVQTAEAVTPAKICHYPRTKIAILLDSQPVLRMRIMASLQAELALAQDQILLLGCKTAPEKIASFLLRLSDAAGRSGDDSHSFYMPMPHRDIAEYLGLAAETVCRVICKLKKLKYIEIINKQRRVSILERDRLLDLAGGESDAWSF